MSLSYLSDSRCRGSLPYDPGALAAWHLGLKAKGKKIARGLFHGRFNLQIQFTCCSVRVPARW